MDRSDQQHTIIVPARPMRATSIKGLIPALPERGKIKIGAKGPKRPTRSGQGEWQPPVKLDHFVITTLARSRDDDNLLRDEEMHERLGDNPTEIPIRLLYDDIELNFPTRYAAYNGRTLWCSGDGEVAQRLGQDGKRYELQCPCHLADPTYTPKTRNDMPPCKMNGSLSVIIDGASGLGGVWKFRTTSYNSINGIMSSMIFLRQITGGILANIPLKLRVQPKQAVNPRDGNAVLVYIVTLEFAGDMETLQKIGHKIALDRATTHVSIANIENEARRMLQLAAPANAPLPGDDAEEVAAEFYPEEYDKESEGWTGNARPTRQQFKAAETQQAKTDPATYEINLIEGRVVDTFSAEETLYILVRDMNERSSVAGQKGLDAFWEDNKELVALLHADGYVEELGALTEECNTISERLAKNELEVRSATVASGDGQAGEQMEESTGTPPKKSSGASSFSPTNPVQVADPGRRDQDEQSAQIRRPGPRPLVDAASPGAPSASGDSGGSAIGKELNSADSPQDRPQATISHVPQPAVQSPGDVTHKPEKQTEVMQNSVDRSTRPSKDNATPPANAEAGGKPRFLVEPITIAGKGMNAGETEAALIAMIKTLQKDEYDGFRQVNRRILGHFSLYLKDGATRLNEALAAKDKEFYG